VEDEKYGILKTPGRRFEVEFEASLRTSSWINVWFSVGFA
jgi:hypothetical protein